MKVSQYRNTLMALENDEQLQIYFSFVLQYAKEFTKNPEFIGCQFSDIVKFSFVSKDNAPEDLNQHIVNQMIKMN